LYLKFVVFVSVDCWQLYYLLYMAFMAVAVCIFNYFASSKTTSIQSLHYFSTTYNAPFYNLITYK